MTTTRGDIARSALEGAERRVFAHYGLDVDTRFVQLSDPPLRVRTLEAGSGPPMLLIGGPSASAWAPLMAELSGFRLIAVDRPGCGLSDPFDYTHVDLRAHGVQFLSSLLDELGLEAPAIAANSMGGLWALWLALDRPERVSVVGQLGCPALFLSTSAPFSKRIMSIRAVNRIAQASSKHALVDQVTGRDGMEALPEEMRECLYRAKLIWGRGRTHLSMLERMLSLLGARAELRFGEEELARLDLPMMFIWGDHDDHGTPEAGRRACAILPRAQLVVIGAGHMPWLDRPGESAAALAPFVRASIAATGGGERVASTERQAISAPPTTGSELEWLRRILWERAPHPQTGDGSGPRRGPRPQRYAAFPTPSKPLFLAPLATRATAAASLRRYNALRPLRRRIVRASVGLGLRVGVVQPFIRGRRTVEADGGWTAEDGGASLIERLSEVFDAPEVIVSISLSRTGPFRKPMLQAMTPRGTVLGYVKVGWNDLTRDLVRTEAANLALWQKDGPRAVGTPDLIHSGAVGPVELCVTAPLPPRIRRYTQHGAAQSIHAVRAVADLHGTEEIALGESVFWAVTRDRLAAVSKVDPGRTADLLGRFADRLESSDGDQPLTFGFWHGDWVPWNLGRVDGRVFAWDWEHGGPNVPLGFDLLHFDFQRGFIAKGQPFTDAASTSRPRGLGLLRALGMGTRTAELVFSLYLLEAFLRYHEPSIAGAGRDRRFDPDSAVHLFEETPAGLVARA